MEKAFYDFLGLLGFAHPLHPVLITMVVGPVIAAFLLGAIGYFFKKPALFETVRPLTVVAFVFWFPTVAVGIIDWLHFYGGGNMVEINAKLILAGILFLILLGHILLFKRVKKDSFLPIVLMFLATVNVSALGYYGGDIVFGGTKTEAKATETSTVSQTNDGFKRLVAHGYTVDWKVEAPVVHVRVSYTTTGWVGIGFGNTGMMEGSHIVLGYALEDGTAVVEDHFGYAMSRHAPQTEVGGKDTLTNKGGSLKDGVTTISFTRPLKTGNPKDPVLVQGEAYQVILAHGAEEAKDVESYHGRDGHVTIELTL